MDRLSWTILSLLKNDLYLQTIKGKTMNKLFVITGILMFFSTPAFAQTGSGGGGGLLGMAPLVIIGIIYYFIWERNAKIQRESWGRLASFAIAKDRSAQ